MTDERVSAQNASITSWWQTKTVRAGTSSDAIRAGKAAKRKLKLHQPEGGVYGQPCTGKHATAEAWPCAVVRGLDGPHR